MNDSTYTSAEQDADRQVTDRLVPLWLEEAARHQAAEARRSAETWRRGELSPDAAQELAAWVTARVTDTAFNDDEGPSHEGPARITVADKEAVHRWLRAQGHPV